MGLVTRAKKFMDKIEVNVYQKKGFYGKHSPLGIETLQLQKFLFPRNSHQALTWPLGLKGVELGQGKERENLWIKDEVIINKGGSVPYPWVVGVYELINY